MFMMVWTECHEGEAGRPMYEDHWLPYDTYQEAVANYDKLVDMEEVYSASICQVIESTDYEGMRLDDGEV